MCVGQHCSKLCLFDPVLGLSHASSFSLFCLMKANQFRLE